MSVGPLNPKSVGKETGKTRVSISFPVRQNNSLDLVNKNYIYMNENRCQ